VLPLDEGSEFDIDESEIHGMPAPVNSALGATTSMAATGAMPINNGDDVLVVEHFGDLPEDYTIGHMAYCRDVGGGYTAYVFDGTEWQNLGLALGKLKPGRDAKCDRRAAIKATKAKNNAE
jgi:hypothetical protein